jgi:hypothetical protein
VLGVVVVAPSDTPTAYRYYKYRGYYPYGVIEPDEDPRGKAKEPSGKGEAEPHRAVGDAPEPAPAGGLAG